MGGRKRLPHFLPFANVVIMGKCIFSLEDIEKMGGGGTSDIGAIKFEKKEQNEWKILN